MWQAVTDLARRRNLELEGTADEWWPGSEPEYTYLAGAAAEWWVAEDVATRQIVGYARSLQRGGLFELTELFVRPEIQSKGVGRALLGRAFPSDRGEVRSIIATTDVRAMSRYFAAGTAAQFPLLTLSGVPADAGAPTTLEVVRLDATQGEDLTEVARIESLVLGFPRGDAELRWIMTRRAGFLYRRGGRAVGYAFVGTGGAGPVAALELDDVPALLLDVERRASVLGMDRLNVQVPGVNARAVRHLTERGFQIDAWVNLLMSNRPFGQFDRFLAFSPMFL